MRSFDLTLGAVDVRGPLVKKREGSKRRLLKKVRGGKALTTAYLSYEGFALRHAHTQKQYCPKDLQYEATKCYYEAVQKRSPTKHRKSIIHLGLTEAAPGSSERGGGAFTLKSVYCSCILSVTTGVEFWIITKMWSYLLFMSVRLQAQGNNKPQLNGEWSSCIMGNEGRPWWCPVWIKTSNAT